MLLLSCTTTADKIGAKRKVGTANEKSRCLGEGGGGGEREEDSSRIPDCSRDAEGGGRKEEKAEDEMDGWMSCFGFCLCLCLCHCIYVVVVVVHVHTLTGGAGMMETSSCCTSAIETHQ